MDLRCSRCKKIVSMAYVLDEGHICFKCFTQIEVMVLQEPNSKEYGGDMLYSFFITGGSPHDGIIKVSAKDINVALALAKKELVKINEGRKVAYPNATTLKLTGQSMREPFKFPCIVHVDSGER